MSEHLTIDEILQAVHKSPQSLAASRYVHFEGCEKCQRVYQNQLSADSILKIAKPKKAPVLITQKVMENISRISPLSLKKKTDWIFLFSLVLLFSIAAWFIFSGRLGSVVKQYTPDVVIEKENTPAPKMIDVIRDGVSAFDFSFELPDLTFGNIYWALGALAILFYMFIDRRISHNFRVRKT